MQNNYQELNRLKLDVLLEELGTSLKKSYDTYIWQCPLCAEEGHDSKKDHLKYNLKIGALTCFKDPMHTEILREKYFSTLYKNYFQNNALEEQQHKITIDKKIELLLKFHDYRENLYQEMLTPRGALDYLESVRGITADTVFDLGIGMKTYTSNYCNNYGYEWTFPTMSYSTEDDNPNNLLMGYEYRPADFSKSGISREVGCGTGLAMINAYSPETEILIVLEGYIDCYVFYQYLHSKNQDKYYHIVTPSNGVTSLIKQVDEIDFHKYKKWILFLDSDDAGRDTANAIKEKYQFFTDYYLTCGCKDFNEHYLNCIRKNNNKE